MPHATASPRNALSEAARIALSLITLNALKCSYQADEDYCPKHGNYCAVEIKSGNSGLPEKIHYETSDYRSQNSDDDVHYHPLFGVCLHY